MKGGQLTALHLLAYFHLLSRIPAKRKLTL